MENVGYHYVRQRRVESWIPSLTFVIIMTEKPELNTTKGGVVNE
jgi:hypothetical protein